MQGARRCVQRHTSELIHKRKDVKNSSQIVCRARGGVCKNTPPNWLTNITKYNSSQIVCRAHGVACKGEPLNWFTHSKKWIIHFKWCAGRAKVWAKANGVRTILVKCTYVFKPYSDSDLSVRTWKWSPTRGGKCYPRWILQINREIENERKPTNPRFDLCFTLFFTMLPKVEYDPMVDTHILV